MRRLVVALSLALALLGVAPPPALAAPAGIFTGDQTGQVAFVDPIVSPGVRSAHEHLFFGATPVHTTETSGELRTHATTWDVQTNHTAVWIPAVYEDGRRLGQFSQHGILAYYQPISGTECNAPEDMAGVTHEYGYRGQIGGGSFSSSPPASSSDGALVVMLQFRGGRDFGVACFPNVRVFVRLAVGAGPIGRITLGGPVAGLDGATGPTTMHADYMFGWSRASFEAFLDACVIPGTACGRNPTPAS
jgi:hypothetical protein